MHLRHRAISNSSTASSSSAVLYKPPGILALHLSDACLRGALLSCYTLGTWGPGVHCSCLLREQKQGDAFLNTLCARRMSAALTSDRPRYLTLPASTNFCMTSHLRLRHETSMPVSGHLHHALCRLANFPGCAGWQCSFGRVERSEMSKLPSSLQPFLQLGPWRRHGACSTGRCILCLAALMTLRRLAWYKAL